MGFFDSIGNAVGGLLGIGGNSNRLTNQVQPIDPRLKQLADQQTQQAAQFRANLPSYVQDQYATASDQMKQEAADTGKDITAAANSRGLLYSGINQGAQAANQGALATGLAQRRANIQAGAEQQATQMENQALQTSLGQMGAGIQNAGIQYGANMDEYKQKMGTISQIQKGLGSVGGGLAGGFGK